jgi:hypothetical protein
MIIDFNTIVKVCPLKAVFGIKNCETDKKKGEVALSYGIVPSL